MLLSVIAGWDLDRLAAAAPGPALARTMPNLAVRHGAGVVAVATRGLDEARQADLLAFLRPLGAVVPLPEGLFGPATALAGSGPGLLALVAEALEEGAVAAGLSRPQAREMTAAVMAGTAALLADGTDPALVRQRVSSPAGATLAGLAVLERGAVRAHIADAVQARPPSTRAAPARPAGRRPRNIAAKCVQRASCGPAGTRLRALAGPSGSRRHRLRRGGPPWRPPGIAVVWLSRRRPRRSRCAGVHRAPARGPMAAAGPAEARRRLGR